MPYYVVGDYYGRGDYYRGDGIFSAIGRGLKVAGAAVLGGGIGFLKGGPLGAAKGAAGAVITTAPMVIQSGIQSETLAAGSMPAEDAARVAMINQQHAMLLAGGGPRIAAMAAPMGMMGMPGAPLMLGAGSDMRRLPGTNKSTYAVRGGGTSRWGPATGQVMLIPKGSVMVKSRRMNVANARALKRGLRRAAGFLKLARKAGVKLHAFKRAPGGRKKK
jgi:hypothetical protein